MRLRYAALLAIVIALSAVPARAQVWRDRIENALAKKVTYDFKAIALADAVRQLAADSEVNMILDDSRLAGVDPMQKVTLKVKDMTIGSALSWLTRDAGLEWSMQDEAIFITTYKQLDEAAKQQIQKRNADERTIAARTWLPAFQTMLAKNVNVTFNYKPLSDVRDSLQILLGVNVILSPNVDATTPVALSVSRMTAENVLSWIAKKGNIDYAIVDEAVYFAPSDEIRTMRSAGLDLSPRGKASDLVSFDFKDTSLTDAFSILSEKSGIKIVVKGDIDPMPHVTASAKDMPLLASIQTVTNAAGLNSAVIPEGSAFVVQVSKRNNGTPAPVPTTEGVPAAPMTSTAPSAPIVTPAPAPAMESTAGTLELPVPSAAALTAPAEAPAK
jgi:hypothetical protein